MATVDELLCEIQTKLHLCTVDQLESVGLGIALPETDRIKAKTKGRTGLLGLINRYLSSEELEESDDQGLGKLKELREVLLGEIPEKVDDKSSQKVGTPESPSDPTSTKVSQHHREYIRRDFKISGQIAGSQQKDGLGFTSLIHQIEAGLRKGYPEEEVVEAVIRATNPGLNLRGYLESKTDITLPKLRRILRSHYQEKGATELYHELSSLTQAPKETPQEFLVRALSIRQRVLFASKESETNQRYEEPLVQAMFLHAVSTGLTSESIRADLKPSLENTCISDELLLEKLNKSASSETERLKKQTKTRSYQAAHAIEATSKKVTKRETPPTPLEESLNGLRVDIEGLKELKIQVAQIQESLSRDRPVSYKGKRGCPKCRSENVGDRCNHCFRCGSGEHYARGCRQRPPGNERGSLLRDEGGPQQ